MGGIIDVLDTHKKKLFWLIHFVSYCKRNGKPLSKRKEADLRTKVYASNSYLVLITNSGDLQITLADE